MIFEGCVKLIVGVWQTEQPMDLNMASKPVRDQDVRPPGAVVEGVGGANIRMNSRKRDHVAGNRSVDRELIAARGGGRESWYCPPDSLFAPD